MLFWDVLKRIIAVEINESRGSMFFLKMFDGSRFRVDEHMLNSTLNGFDPLLKLREDDLIERAV